VTARPCGTATRGPSSSSRPSASTSSGTVRDASASSSPSTSARTSAGTEPPHEERPATYVVEEGDTLYKLALRFYGRRSAWQKIRDANKATVTTDGRIQAGQTLVLP